MGKRQRKRAAAAGRRGREAAAATDYNDDEGNVLTLRDELSAGTARLLRDLESRPAATADDAWQRRSELLFERFVVRWVIADLPLEGQRELLDRYRLADQQTREWVRRTIEAHVAEHAPELRDI